MRRYQGVFWIWTQTPDVLAADDDDHVRAAGTTAASGSDQLKMSMLRQGSLSPPAYGQHSNSGFQKQFRENETGFMGN